MNTRSNTRPAVRQGVHPPGWQALKSAATREQLLDAALECFIRYGYSGTTTSKIADHAGLSRGAMLHHFPSRDALIQSAVTHIINRRIEMFRRDVHSIPADHPNRIRAGLDAYWAHLTGSLFTAFHELAVAARTDPGLAQILTPAAAEFEQSWYNNVLEAFPEWQPTGKVFDLAMDLTQHLLEGMAIAQLHKRDASRAKNVIDWIEAELTKMLHSATT